MTDEELIALAQSGNASSLLLDPLAERLADRIYSAGYWRKQVSILLIQLVQEVHAMNPGIRIDADLNPIIQMSNSVPHAEDVSR
jgi:hypothetical protein